MRKFFFIIIITLLYGEDNLDFDSLMTNAFGKDATKSIVQKIKKNSYSISYRGVIKVRGYSFFRKTDYKNRNNDRRYIDVLAEIGSKFKKCDFLANISIFAMYGSDYTTYDYKSVLKEFRDFNKKVPIAGIKELYFIYNFLNSDILIGKKIFKVGISTLYSPSDVYSVTLSPDPLDPYTIGIWMIKYSYYQGESTEYTIAIFPFISNSKTFSPKSRWAGDEDNEVYNKDFVIPVDSEVIEDKSNKIRVLLRYKSNCLIFNRGVDYILDIGYGPSLYTILEKTKSSNIYLETRPLTWYISSGFSTTYKKFEFHGEIYYQYVLNSLDDDFISLVVGTSYNLDRWIDKLGFRNVNLIIEYVKEIITRKAENEKTFKSSDRERAFKNDFLIKIDGKINDKLSFIYFSDFRLEVNKQNDSGRYQQIKLNYRIKDGLESSVFVEFFNGDVNSYYGRWKKNDRIGIELKYTF